jgi:hypothetical protein
MACRSLSFDRTLAIRSLRHIHPMVTTWRLQARRCESSTRLRTVVITERPCFRLPVGNPHKSPLADAAFTPAANDLQLATIDHDGTMAMWQWTPAAPGPLMKKWVATREQVENGGLDQWSDVLEMQRHGVPTVNSLRHCKAVSSRCGMLKTICTSESKCRFLKEFNADLINCNFRKRLRCSLRAVSPGTNQLV